MIIIVVAVGAALLAHWIVPYDPSEQDLSATMRPPVWLGGTWQHVLGSDHLGRDVLSRIVYGARISLLVGIACVVLSAPIGIAIGLISGFAGGKIGETLMRLAEIQLSIPTILLAIAVVTVLGPGLRNVIITLSVTGWPVYARIIRAETLGEKNKDYVEAAHALGAGVFRIMFRHLLGNVISPAIVVASFAVADFILLEATLSFLGLGVPANVVTWGRMLNEGRLYLGTAWWITAFPGLALFLVILAINLIGDYVRDRFDPRLQNI
jgi:peptide/nickel transport system permease protein